MAKSRGEAPGFTIAPRMCAKGILSEKGEGGAKGAQDPRVALEKRSQDRVEKVLSCLTTEAATARPPGGRMSFRERGARALEVPTHQHATALTTTMTPSTATKRTLL